jgi:hypothetical protein
MTRLSASATVVFGGLACGRNGIRLGDQFLREQFLGQDSDVFDRQPELPIARYVALVETLLGDRVEPLNCGESSVELGVEIFIELLGRLVDALRECFGRDLAVAQHRLSPLAFLFVALGLFGRRHRRRLPVLPVVVALVVERLKLNRSGERGGTNSRQLAATRVRVAREERIPVLLEQPAKQLETAAQSCEAPLLDERLSVENRHPEILTFFREQLFGESLGRVVVRYSGRIPRRRVYCLAQIDESLLVAQILAAGATR